MDTEMGQISDHGAASIAMERPTTAASMEVATPPRTMLLKPLRFRWSDLLRTPSMNISPPTYSRRRKPMTWATFSKWPTYSEISSVAPVPRPQPAMKRPVWMTAKTAAMVHTLRRTSSRVTVTLEQSATAKQSAQREMPSRMALKITFMV